AGERSDHLVRAGGRSADGGAEESPRLERQLVVSRHDGGPAPEEERAEVVYGFRHRQPGGRIVRARPIELQAEARARRPRGARAVADGEWTDLGSAVAADPEEAGPLRRAKPLVAVAAVVGGAKVAEGERHHARRVRAIH